MEPIAFWAGCLVWAAIAAIVGELTYVRTRDRMREEVVAMRNKMAWLRKRNAAITMQMQSIREKLGELNPEIDPDKATAEDYDDWRHCSIYGRELHFMNMERGAREYERAEAQRNAAA